MTDESIVAEFYARSENAIKNTAEKYGHFLRNIAFNILHIIEDAEECVNDTYFTAWRQIPPDRPNKLSAYLGRITRCMALNKFDYNRAGKRDFGVSVQLSELEECLSDKSTVEEKYESGEIAKTVSDFLRTLSSEKRNIFIRRYWFSDDIGDIADRFGMSESKVKSILFRVRKKLKNYLEKEGVNI